MKILVCDFCGTKQICEHYDPSKVKSDNEWGILRIHDIVKVGHIQNFDVCPKCIKRLKKRKDA
jgi:hypothetical protein